jgi:hypothetical protein
VSSRDAAVQDMSTVFKHGDRDHGHHRHH